METVEMNVAAAAADFVVAVVVVVVVAADLTVQVDQTSSKRCY